MKEIDKYILLKLEELKERVHRSYDAFEFHLVYHSIYGFCVNDLSAFYLDIVKDRLYCDRKDSLSRRAAQTVMYEILMSLIKMMAPVLSFTAEDIYKRVASGSVFHQKLPEPNPHYLDRELEDRWEKIIEVRGEAYKKIEELRIAKTVGQPLECDVRIEADDKLFSVLKSVEAGLAEILMVSSVRIEKGAALSISASKTDNKKCVRCWRYFPEINSDGICKRCEGAV